MNTPGRTGGGLSLPGAVRPPRAIGIFGAAPDTGNLGVGALSRAMLENVLRRAPGASVVVFDHGRGMREEAVGIDGQSLSYRRCGAVWSRRLYRPENLLHIRACAGLGGLGNPAANFLRSCGLVLDISAGDSFSDLYGPGRFAGMCATKELALELGVPLVLMPQTYGPFRSGKARDRARRIIAASSMAWARDGRSLGALRELLGDEFDPTRHRASVDVAFALDPRAPSVMSPALRSWLGHDAQDRVAVNISGLLANDADQAADQFSLRADYPRAMLEWTSGLLARGDACVLLVPHVRTTSGHSEHDVDACRALRAALPRGLRRRTLLLEQPLDPSQAKWVIGKGAWFCGARMHSVIAALSQGVPAAALSYSDKFRGVLESCGQGPHTIDLRERSTGEVVADLAGSWEHRGRARASLARALPGVLAQTREVFDAALQIPTPARESLVAA